MTASFTLNCTRTFLIFNVCFLSVKWKKVVVKFCALFFYFCSFNFYVRRHTDVLKIIFKQKKN